MRESLVAMRQHAKENDVKSIAMGRLGSQEDGLNFNEVTKEIENVFYDTNMDLIVYARRT